MRNWSGNHHWHPSRVVQPTTEREVVTLVRQALGEGRKIRPVGSAHSFMPLSATDDILLDLRRMSGLGTGFSGTEGSHCIPVRAGTTLHELNELLAARGLALENMGDIDVQTVAGAISTGTHGTGLSFGNLSTQVVALRMVDGRGQQVVCSETENPELLRAARLGLGLLGVITEVTLRCVPAYHLELRIEKRPLREVIADYPSLNDGCRHFEAYWFPHTPWTMTKQLSVAPGGGVERASPVADYLQEIVLENYGFQALCDLSYRWPSLTPKLSRLAASLVSKHRKLAASYRVFSTPRLVRFNEMEYAVPLEAFPEVMREVEKRVNTHHTQLFFPLECRFVAGDRASYLSPAYGRDTAYIACHVYHRKDYRPFLEDLEAIFRAYDGRPHWGKLHTLEQSDLAALYPRFEDFNRQRVIHDPEGLFLSPRMAALFGKVMVS